VACGFAMSDLCRSKGAYLSRPKSLLVVVETLRSAQGDTPYVCQWPCNNHKEWLTIKSQNRKAFGFHEAVILCLFSGSSHKTSRVLFQFLQDIPKLLEEVCKSLQGNSEILEDFFE
jgi:hypothetical protein